MSQSNDPWVRTHLFQYWDQREDAIGRFADALRKLDEDAVQSAIGREIRVKAHASPPKLLAETAFVMSDDLYRAASVTPVWDATLARYLEASAGSFGRVLAERELVVEYVVDNTFAPDNMQRPLTLFGPWFSSAGFVYICPQAIAVELAKVSGEPAEGAALNPRLQAEARDVANQLVSRCRNERRHHMYLDVDFQIDSLDFLVNQAGGLSGVVSVFRNLPPVAGTNAQVRLPTRSDG